ncbi:unnamed protein product, partial [marine sediment metagenome]
IVFLVDGWWAVIYFVVSKPSQVNGFCQVLYWKLTGPVGIGNAHETIKIYMSAHEFNRRQFRPGYLTG